MSEIRCKYRLPSPAVAGYTTLEALKEHAAASPHLRPCPMHKGSKGTWDWTYRKYCEKCPNAVRPVGQGVNK